MLLVLSSAGAAFAQTTLSLKFKRNNIWEDYSHYAVCPNVLVEYQVLNWNSACHTLTVVNGFPEGDVSSDVTSDGKISIQWKDNGDSCFINVKRKSDSSCSSAALTKKFFIPVLSLAKVKPTITQVPAGKLDVGFVHNVTYVASAQYPWLGKKDSLNLNDFKLTEFIWTIPSGWTLTSSGQFETITVQTNVNSGGNVTAKAWNRRCLSIGSFSDNGTFKAERKMPSPCFSTGPSLSASQFFELCGESIQNTFNCANLPANFALPPGGVTYNWSVSPADGWTKIGELDNTVKYKTDGQKDRVVTVTVSAYGVSASCSLTIPLLLANPLTQAKGEEFFCVQDTFQLSHPLPSGSSVKWEVVSLTPGIPPAVSPLSGTGDKAILSVGGGGSLHKIAFKITGCSDSLILVDTFFAGTPALFDLKINGVPGSQALVCPGTHTASLKLSGTNAQCVEWENSGNNPVFLACLEANAYISGFNGTTALIARAKNECGSNDVRFFLSPRNWGCNGWGWDLKIYPNPAVGQITVETQLEEKSNLTEKPKMNGIRLVSNMGNVVYETAQVSDSFSINLGGVAPGTYTLQTTVDGIPVSETVQVKLQ